MTISAVVPIAQRDAANQALEDAGFGQNNFSVMLHMGAAPATHAGFHAWDDDAFIAAVEGLSIPSLRILKERGQRVNFADHIQAQGLRRKAAKDSAITDLA